MFAQLFAVAAIFACAHAHSYKLGGCPEIEPMSGFEMNKMLGLWYVIQKTSTASDCITYNFTAAEEPGHYNLEQVSQHFALGLTPIGHHYRYTGYLTVKDRSVPAKMTVKFPLSVAGTASYTVFMTDYDTHAGIYTCQSLPFSARHSATILSRTRSLDKIYVDKIRTKLSSNNIDPYDLSIVNQNNCPKSDDSGYNINIDRETFSPQSIAGVVRKAGEKIGDGVEYVAEGAKTIYEKLADKKDESSKQSATVNPDAEWLP